MALNGYNAEQPLSVRLFLALSIALLCHTLLAVLIVLPDRPEPRQQHTLRLTLAAPAQTVREDTSTASRPSQSQPVSSSANQPSAPSGAADDQPQSHPDPAPATQDREAPRSPAPNTSDASTTTSEAGSGTASPAEPQNPTRPSDDTIASESAAPTTTDTGNQPGQTRLTQAPDQTDPYIAKLWQAVGQAIDQQGIRNLRDLDGPRTLRISLQLLPSGVITRADVLSSSGIPKLDRIAHRAALRASPYPPVPDTHTGRRQFKLTLSFRPTPRDR